MRLSEIIHNESVKKASETIETKVEYNDQNIERAVKDFIESGAVKIIEVRKRLLRAQTNEKITYSVSPSLKLVINFKDFHPNCCSCDHWDFGGKCKLNKKIEANHDNYCGKHSEL